MNNNSLKQLTEKERLITFFLLVNFIMNLIISVLAYNYREDNYYGKDYTKFFYPFVEIQVEKFMDTKLLLAYNTLEFIVYSILPIIFFIIWIKVFKLENKKQEYSNFEYKGGHNV